MTSKSSPYGTIQLLRILRRQPLLFAGFVGVATVSLLAILAPLVAPYPEDAGSATHVDSRLLPPSADHLFGTDQLGRDILSRVLFGARISLSVSVAAIALALAIGVPLGVIAGYTGGVTDESIMRGTELIMSFPELLRAMAVMALLGPSLLNAVLALAVGWWTWHARLVRSQALSIRETAYVEAARAMGASWFRVVFRHVLPQCLVPATVQVSMDLGGIILTFATLSFLGIGAQPPTPEWGLMVSSGRTYFLTQWWITLFPGLAIFLTVLSFNLLGDGLREIMDPRMRGHQRRG